MAVMIGLKNKNVINRSESLTSFAQKMSHNPVVNKITPMANRKINIDIEDDYAIRALGPLSISSDSSNKVF